jgi:CBS domain-containing protein
MTWLFARRRSGPFGTFGAKRSAGSFDQGAVMKAKDIMSVPVVEIAETATVERAAQLMLARRTGILVVTKENGEVRGVVTDRDLLLRCVALGQDPSFVTVGETTTGQDASDVTLGEATSGPDTMGGQIIMVKPDDDLEDVIEVMHEAGVHRVIVSQDGKHAAGLLSFDEIAVDVKRYLDEFLSVASRYHKV